MRELPVLPTGDEDDRELEALGGVKRHHGHDAVVGVRQLIGVGDKRYPFEEGGKRTRIGFAFTHCCGFLVVRIDQPGRVSRVGTEFPCHADEFVQVVESRAVLRIAARRKLGAVAGALEHRLGNLTDVTELERFVLVGGCCR